MARWLRTRLGGYTGDTLGAAQQGAEVAAYLALVASLARA
jgi:adenosylcobinamide-GDP ribazoletransferase